MRREKEWIKPNKYYNITRRIITSISPPLARTSCLFVMPIHALPIYLRTQIHRAIHHLQLAETITGRISCPANPTATCTFIMITWRLYCNNILDASRHFFLPRFETIRETIWYIETFLDKKPCTGWVAISIFCKLRETVFNFKQKAFHLMQKSGLQF